MQNSAVELKSVEDGFIPTGSVTPQVPLDSESSEDTPNMDSESTTNKTPRKLFKKYHTSDFLMAKIGDDTMSKNKKNQETNKIKDDTIISINDTTKTEFDWKKAIPILLKLGRWYATYGAPAHRIESRMLELCETVGIYSKWAALPTLLTVSFGKDESLDTITKLVPMKQSFSALGKEYLIDCLIDQIICGEITLFDANTELDKIINAKNMYHRVLVLFAFGMESAAASTLWFNGNMLEFGISFALGIITGLTDWLSVIDSNFGLFADIISAILIAFISVHVSSYIQICFQAVVLSGIVWNLPGISIAISMHELASGNSVSGVVRLFNALFVSIKLAFGIAIGTKLAFWLVVPTTQYCTRELSQWLDFLWLPMVTIGFIILLNSHFRQWPGMFATSFVSYIVSYGCQQMGDSAQELVPIIASFVSALTANLIGKYTHGPSIPYVMAGIIPLVPGSLALKAALFVESDVTIGISLSYQMLIVALQLTVGVFVATLLVHPVHGIGKI